MDEIPFVDWDGNGRIDPLDIALTLAMRESMEEDGEEEEEEEE
jgi:hypothetical protein